MADLGVGLIALLAVVILAIVVTRVAASALTLTGMARDAAKFQARSAFFGVGFTTAEAEQIVTHPVRRRIVGGLMLFGNAGIITVIASLVLSFSGTADPRVQALRFAILIASLAFLWILSASRGLERVMHRIISAALRRWTRIDTHDYVAVLELEGGYAVTEMQARERDWISGRTLAEARLRDEGIIILGIRRKDRGYIGAPRGTTRIEAGDMLFAYGATEAIAQVEDRPWGHLGEAAHAAAVQKEKEREEE